MRKKEKAPAFKEYIMNQADLFPTSLSDMIPDKHLVRVISDFIDQMDISPILSTYKGGGTSSYHPRMLLKVIVYAYSQKVYSSRNIAKALRENIHFMWLSGNSFPDFRTISRFRSSRLKQCIDQVFVEVVNFLLEQNYVKLENYFLDGTIVEASANKYTWVWKKSTKRYKENVQKKIAGLLEQIDTISEKEERLYGSQDLEELGEHSQITSEMVKEKAEQVSQELEKLLAEKEELPEDKVKKKS